MRVVLSLLGLAVIAGCAPDLEREPPPLPMTLDELAVDVDSASRGFFLSDRTGGFVTGTISAGAPTVELSWGAWGTEILHSLALREEPSGKALEVAGGRILPSHARIRFAGGTELEIEPLETAREDVHALLLVATTGSNALVPQFVTPPGFRAPQSLAGQGGLFWRGERGTLVLYGDVSREEGAPGLLLPGTGVRRFLLCYSAGNRGAEATARELFAHMDSLRETRGTPQPRAPADIGRAPDAGGKLVQALARCAGA
jgi:hypothetical protein